MEKLTRLRLRAGLTQQAQDRTWWREWSERSQNGPLLFSPLFFRFLLLLLLLLVMVGGGVCVCLDQLEEDIRFSCLYFYFARPRTLNLTK